LSALYWSLSRGCSSLYFSPRLFFASFFVSYLMYTMKGKLSPSCVCRRPSGSFCVFFYSPPVGVSRLRYPPLLSGFVVPPPFFGVPKFLLIFPPRFIFCFGGKYPPGSHCKEKTFVNLPKCNTPIVFPHLFPCEITPFSMWLHP